MLFKVASYRVPASARRKFTRIVREVIEASNNEPGIVGYRGGFDLHDTEVFTLTGLYKNEDAFNRHLESDHMQKALSALRDFKGNNGTSAVEFMSAASLPCTEREHNAEKHVRSLIK